MPKRPPPGGLRPYKAKNNEDAVLVISMAFAAMMLIMALVSGIALGLQCKTGAAPPMSITGK